MKILFAIPDSRLVSVWYKKNNVTYSTTIPNPGCPENLVMALLPKKIGMSQVQSVRPVKEWAPRN